MIYLKTICAIFCHWCYLTLSILKVFMKYYFSIFFSTCSESYRKIMILQKIRRLFCLKRSDQEIKQPSKQQELICPVASKMQNGHMAIKSIIISQTAEIHGACGKAFRPSLTISPPPQACDDDTSLPDALNHFYSRFEMQNDTSAQKLPTPPNDQALCLSPADVRKTLSRINPRKAAGPDNIPGRVLKDCAEQLTHVLTDIFNTSLSQAVIPTCLKSTTIIPVPKNHLCPV